jgi:hypothetical protein
MEGEPGAPGPLDLELPELDDDEGAELVPQA